MTDGEMCTAATYFASSGTVLYVPQRMLSKRLTELTIYCISTTKVN
jgi:hypothetical protein